MRGHQALYRLLLVGFFALAAGPVVAQPSTGSLMVHVVDTKSQSLPGAVVTLTGGKRSWQQITNGQGKASFFYLAPGIYKAKAQLGSFPPATFPNIPITAGRQTTIQMTLHLQ